MNSIVRKIREIFKMLNQYAVDYPTFPVKLCLSHLIQFLVECSECRAAKMDRQVFGTRMVFCETFLQIQLFLLQHRIEFMEFSYSRTNSPITGGRRMRTKPPVQDQRCQSRPSAKNSVIPSEGGFAKNYGADQQRLQISDLHLDKILHTSNVCLLEDEIQD